MKETNWTYTFELQAQIAENLLHLMKIKAPQHQIDEQWRKLGVIVATDPLKLTTLKWDKGRYKFIG